ncbi:unnamed protein product [Leptosia nina]|uniref:Kazal-like domain-containing protein n=1 Tax=Leptosia nina TaxID=320188 RepID=A0AAV1JB03_9NEOP
MLSVALMLGLLYFTSQEPIESLEDILAYPMEPATKPKRQIETEGAKSKQAKFVEFVEEKLIQHTQALEHVLKTATNVEDLIKELIHHFSKNMEKPKLPEKVEVHQTRRRNAENETENPIIKFGKGFPTYGTLFKDMIMRAFERDDAPTPLVEKHKSTKESRRSFGGRPIVVPSTDDNGPSPWCSIAVLCHRTYNPVCGYDDNFGYGKFDDICHMLQVNCYWKYNFALVPSCRPVL